MFIAKSDIRAHINGHDYAFKKGDAVEATAAAINLMRDSLEEKETGNDQKKKEKAND